MRGSGRTTRLIKAAPPGSIFIAQTYNIAQIFARYSREQIRNKNDVIFISPSEMQTRLRGVRPTGIVLDHEVQLTAEDRDFLNATLVFTRCLFFTSDADGDVVCS